MNSFSYLCVDNRLDAEIQPIMAVCTDGSRCGSAVYSDGVLNLVGDKRDSNDPYKGLDIVIQRIDPRYVIVSGVQKRVIQYLEKRFKFDLVDLSVKRFKNNLSTQSQAPDPKRSRIDEDRPIVNISAVDLHLSQQTINSIGPSQSMPTHATLIPPSAQDSIPPPEDDPLESPNLGIIANFSVILVPNLWFSMSSAIKVLISSDLTNNQGLNTDEQKILYINSKVQKSIDVCAVRAISAIKFWLDYQQFDSPDSGRTQNSFSTRSLGFDITGEQEFSEFHTDPMPIIDVKYISPGPVLSIDRPTIESLGIFDRIGVNSEKRREENIEALPSLYHLLNQCQSSVGKRQLKTMMLWPLQDVNEINYRQDAIEFFIRKENKIVQEQIALQLKNIVPLGKLLVKLNQSVANYRDMTSIYKSLWSFVAIIDLIKACERSDVQILGKMIELDSPELRSVIDSIVNIIDFESSRKEKRVQICVGVDKEVDEKKDLGTNLLKILDKASREETVKYRNLLGKTCEVVYIARVGFINSVEYNSTAELDKIRHNQDFNVLVFTESKIYFKTPQMLNLDDNAGDVACDIIDAQESVMIDLQAQILKHSEKILSLMELCAELDCLISLAIVSFERGYTRPEFVSAEDGLNIKEAFHPIQAMKHEVVPNDIRFYKESAARNVKIMIATGPNSCGKTTLMRATCLVVYMAHIGCYVPALKAHIPVVDAILTRIHSTDSISTGLSSFASDIHQINYALNRATEKSLIVIDEFGESTLSTDGFLLLKGLTTYFAQKGSKSPYVMIATHFNRMIEHLSTYSEQILCKTFKVSRDLSKNSVCYEFKMLNGIGQISLADDVAARAGLPTRVIERAKNIKEMMLENRPIGPEPPSGA